MEGRDWNEKVERPMENHNPDSEPAALPGAGAADKDRDGTAVDNSEDDRLVDLLRKWEERYFRHEDPSPESLCVHDPALLEALRDRINQRKRLHSFLGLSTEPAAEVAAAGQDDELVQPARARTPPVTEPQEERLVTTPTQVDPEFIGRYRVSRVLGEGAFGRVYLAHDAELDRLVAIKVPVTHRAAEFVDLEAYLNEARVLARLSHPNIVPVYDVGHTEDGRCYVVSKYLDGGDLAARLARGRPAFSQSAELVAVLCEALHYAHTQDLFHRDIKPANILIDAAGVPFLADFGLALKDENFGRGARFVGTAAYTSPEQARGEGHLVDGRSDIFSLGIVFYEMLTCRRPFRGDSLQNILQQIKSAEPRPPRQIDDTIPRELERICMKALSKRASERYSNARDMAEDLRHFLKATGAGSSSQALSLGAVTLTTTAREEPPPTTISGPSELSGHPIRIIPKGLCSFDKHDADFFLELLPGPRDRDGLPDGLRFWKARIEPADPNDTFRVGIIYGPSGCGKSSLVKAGLLPLLSLNITKVYVEATAATTEAHLLRGIQKAFPQLSSTGGLVESLSALRRGRHLRPGSKVLIVLDQFEQWLFARRHEEGTELVAALRQCDGENLQALCLVRDDFWMATTRFTSDLEIDLVPDRNIAAVDLFEPRHARKVLEAFGRAYEALPAEGGDLAREQHLFLDQAVAALAQDGKVVPVRLALFAEMVKGKPWTSATIKEVGGMEGVGVKFLEETFSSGRSSPMCRYHQKAAQAVLKSLLPETNADLKGRMRSIEELRDTSGYTERPGEFGDLIRILDNDLRLITPVDLESSIDDDVPATVAAGGRYYQLTHDYLVHSLRDWLTRKQRGTRRGRAELLLVERSALWNAKPERLHLPSAREWLRIRILTLRKDWTLAQRRMMTRAARLHGARLVGLFAGLALLTGAAVAIHVFSRTNELLVSIPRTEVEKIPEVLSQLSGFPRWIYSGRLRDLRTQDGNDSRSQLGYSLALLPGDPGQIDYLYGRLLAADPAETAVLRASLKPYRDSLTSRLWSELRSARSGDHRLLPVAGLLAHYDPANPSWAEVGDKVAGAIVLKIEDVRGWREELVNIRVALTDPLARIYREKARPEVEHTLATTLLSQYAGDKPALMVELLLDADPKSFSILFPIIQRNRLAAIPKLRQAITFPPSGPPPVSVRTGTDTPIKDQMHAEESEQSKDEHAARRARAAVALARLGEASEVWHLLQYSPDPRSRSAFINALYPLGIEPAILADELKELLKISGTGPVNDESVRGKKNAFLFDPATSKRRGLILSLATYRPEALGSTEREELVATLIDLFRNDPDAGVHSAAELVLKRWGHEGLPKIEPRLPRAGEEARKRWYVSAAGPVMVKVDGPVEFDMGSPPSDTIRQKDEIFHRQIIPRRFAIASREVTVDEFQRFAKAKRGKPHEFSKGYSPDIDGPQIDVSWFEGAEYCNWLGEQEQPPLSRCYLPNDQGKYAEGMRVDAEAVAKGGYRLPTDAEWEYACRAGAATSRYYGNTPDLLAKYEWYILTSGFHAHSCGRLLPNELGLFDMLGNVYEWCHDRLSEPPQSRDRPIRDDISKEVVSGEKRNLRGETYAMIPPGLRSAYRTSYEPKGSRPDIGFRPARTIP
ncbi:MAG: SUMF1/EgtB/PvdO family nonheme iron enzyme [Isosphaerales bacterium]